MCAQVPCLTYGMRGMIAASVEVKGPSRDLHSGNEGGAQLWPLFPLTHTPFLCPSWFALIHPKHGVLLHFNFNGSI